MALVRRVCSSSVRLPLVFSASISSESITLFAATRLIDFFPVEGCGSWPRKSPAFCAWRRTKLLKRGSGDCVDGMLVVSVARFSYWAN